MNNILKTAAVLALAFIFGSGLGHAATFSLEGSLGKMLKSVKENSQKFNTKKKKEHAKKQAAKGNLRILKQAQGGGPAGNPPNSHPQKKQEGSSKSRSKPSGQHPKKSLGGN